VAAQVNAVLSIEDNSSHNVAPQLSASHWQYEKPFNLIIPVHNYRLMTFYFNSLPMDGASTTDPSTHHLSPRVMLESVAVAVARCF
jgi:hypothetical protein